MASIISFLRVASLGTLLAFGGFLQAADETKPAKADNSKMNKHEAATDKGAKTADSQTMTATDRELAAKVRKAITSDKTLSTYAHNVKVIAKDGMVTLKGPVRTEEEKSAIEAKATEVAGAGKVTNEITIAPKKT